MSLVADDRRCSRCGESKPRAAFRSNPRMGDGLSSWCAACANAANREWRAGNGRTYALGYNSGRRVQHPRIACAGCGLRFRAPRRDSRFCCDACREALRVNGHPKTGENAALHHRLHALRETAERRQPGGTPLRGRGQHVRSAIPLRHPRAAPSTRRGFADSVNEGPSVG